jgi:hypothetical protein
MMMDGVMGGRHGRDGFIWGASAYRMHWWAFLDTILFAQRIYYV